MADENILTRLGKLFQNQIVVRKTDDGQVKVKDVEFSQTALTSNFIDRYNRINSSGYGASSYAAKQNASAYDVARKELFRDYELMDADPIISSALDILIGDSVEQHISLSKGTPAEKFIRKGDWTYYYRNKEAMQKDSFAMKLREANNIKFEIIFCS